MKKIIKFSKNIFIDEHAFLHAIKSVSIQHIYDIDDEEEFKKIFLPIKGREIEIDSICCSLIKKIQMTLDISDSKLNDYEKEYDIYNVCFNHIETVILSAKLTEVKHQKLRTELSVTNLLLLKILDDTEERYNKISIINIYELDTDEINDEIYRHCFKQQEQEYRLIQSKYEKKYLKYKSSCEKQYFKDRKNYLNKIQSLKNRKAVLTENIHSLEYQITAQIENDKKLVEEEKKDFNDESVLCEYDNIDSIQVNVDNTIDLPINGTPEIPKNIIQINIKEAEKKLKKLRNDLELFSGNTNNEKEIELLKTCKIKLEALKTVKDNGIKNARKGLREECLKLEEKILVNSNNEDDFFNKVNKNVNNQTTSSLSWHKDLHLPNKRSTNKNKDTSKICTVEKNIPRRKKDLIWNVLQYLESYDLLIKDDTHDEIDTLYKLNLEHNQEHQLKGKFVIKAILPLLGSYIKFNNGHNVTRFLEKLDSIIEYSWQNPAYFSEEYTTEQLILKAYADNHYLNIETSKQNYKNISEFQLCFDLNMHKELLFMHNSKETNIKLTDITSITVQNIEDSIQEQGPKSQQNKFSQHISKYNIPDRGESRVILIADISHSEFFDARPLKNQIIYKTKNSIKQFKDENALEEVGTKNKIIIEAVDTQDKIIYIVQKSIPHVKILEPSVIKDKFNAIIKTMCDEI